jgi:F-type H+-transporting ATPase subunit delta
MGVLANHVPSIEQLKPGLVEIVEEGGANKKFFRMSDPASTPTHIAPRLPCFTGHNQQSSSKANRICTVSGGFAVVQPNSELSINAVEGFPLEDFSAEVGLGHLIPETDFSTNNLSS